MDDLDEIVKLGGMPLPADAPSFADFKYDDDYDELKGIFSPSNFEEIKWDEVLISSTEMFEKKVKHIQVAQWMGEALVNIHQYAGLECCLNVLHDLLKSDDIWKTVEPPKIDKRASAIRTFEEKIIRWLKEPDANGSKFIESLVSKLDEIKELLIQRFPESDGVVPPSFSALQEKLAPYIVESEAEKSSEQKSNASEGESDDELNATGGSDSTSTVITKVVVNHSLEDAVKKAQNFAKEGQLNKGLTLLQQGYFKSTHLRERFFWSLAKVRLLYGENKIELALFELRQLDKIIEQYKIEDWEPQISIDVSELFLMCCDEDEKTKKSSEREKSYTRLCRLDMALSLKFA